MYFSSIWRIKHSINHLTESDLEVLESQFAEYSCTDKRTIIQKRLIFIFLEVIDNEKLNKVNFDVLAALLSKIKNSFISDNIHLRINTIKLAVNTLIIIFIIKWSLYERGFGGLDHQYGNLF